MSPKLQFRPLLRRRNSVGALILTACLAFSALLASTAQAAPEGDATMQIDSFTLDGGQTGDGQAFCPAGTRVVGGGITSTVSTLGHLRVSGPLDESGLTSHLNDGDVGRSWYAQVQNNSSTTNTYFVAAICSASSDATIQTHTFTLQSDEGGPGQAFCPTGTRLIGGGITGTEAGRNSVIGVAGPLDETGLTSNLADGDVGRSYFASVDENDPLSNTFVSTAICSPSSDATIRVDPFLVQAGESGYGQAVCPSDTRLVGGGVTGVGSTGSFVRTSGPLNQTGSASSLADGDVARSWYAEVNNQGPGSNTYVSTAICAPRVIQPQPLVQPTGQRAAALAKCKKKHSARARKKCRKKAKLLPG